MRTGGMVECIYRRRASLQPLSPPVRVLHTRPEGEGWCRMPALPVAARAALHHWEEPPSPMAGLRTIVYFSGYSSLAVSFCQNVVAPTRDFERSPSPACGEICLELIRQGAQHQFCNPTPPARAHIVPGAGGALPVPVVWNTGGYDRVRPPGPGGPGGSISRI